MSATASDPAIDVGVIGGSGLYDLDSLTEVRRIPISTPYGEPSDTVLVGRLGPTTVGFLPRHGSDHRFSPTHIPARANIYALKRLGARELLGVSAVGSLRADLHPGDLVVPDQLVDRTGSRRASTFFDEKVVVHVPFGDPFCHRLRSLLTEAARTATGAAVHDVGTYCCIEGPQFSTRAESELYRSWGLDIIGMTAVPEAKLAREAELCYATLALVTDYDCWHTGHDEVSASAVAEVMRANTVAAKATLMALLASVPDGPCGCHTTLASSIITPLHTARPTDPGRAELLLRRYLATSVTEPVATAPR
jgi:5'-methylthioadenosine phosphorylase